MSATHRMTPARRAALHKAQMASAAKRRGHGNTRYTHYYGTGIKGWRNARRATYGSRRHGLSIAQQKRRRARMNKWARRGGKAIALAGMAYTGYKMLPQPVQNAAKARAKDYAHTQFTKVKYRKSGLDQQINRAMKGK